ncbi:MAG: hypothetical protein WA160_06445 [Pseudobdellovibrio sp.]
MSNKIIFKKYLFFDSKNEEIGTVTLEHLWADVFGLRIKRTEKFSLLSQWESAFQEALVQAQIFNARQVIFRLIKDNDSEELGRMLQGLGFQKKNERVEYRKPIDELPDDEGSPIIWKSAAELCWSHQEIANTLKLVATGDPDTDPNEDPLLFIQDILADPFLTSGLQCIHIGFIEDKIAALTVVQTNLNIGWTHISYMGTALKFRNKNLGQWVHRYSFRQMRIQGCKLYHGGTNSTNKPMIQLFEKHGCNLFCEMEEWIYFLKRVQS